MTTIIRNDPGSTATDMPVVMKLADFARQAREVVLDARKEAARIVAEARRKGDILKTEAARQGHDQGFAEGQRQGRQRGERTAADRARTQFEENSARVLERADAILDSLETSRSDACGPAADEVVHLAIDLAGRIVGRLAIRDISVARTNLAKAMRLIGSGSGGEITVAVNPAQLAELRDDFADLIEAMNSPGRSRLVADPGVSPGGVQITTARGRIDATVEAQLDKVASALAAEGLADSPGIETCGKACGKKARKLDVTQPLRIVDSDVSV